MLSGLQRIKPGRISSSSIPFSLNFRFSPGAASSVSTSSLSRFRTSTVCCPRQIQTYLNKCSIFLGSASVKILKGIGLLFSLTAGRLKGGHSRARQSLTRFGIMVSCWALLMDPDSSFPRITVPMSFREQPGQKNVNQLLKWQKIRHL